MKNKWMAAVSAAALLLSLSSPALCGADSGKEDAGPLRLGFCQAEKYYEFDYQLYYIAEALAEDGLLQGVDLDGLTQESSTREIWDRVCETQESSSPVCFAPDGYVDYSDPEYSKLDEEETSEAVKNALSGGDVDLVVSMGTSAGLLVKGSTDLPFMNFVASDPVGAGIVSGAPYSGDNRSWALVSPGSDIMSLGVMNDLFAPKKVGVVYADNEDAYIYSGAQNLDAFAEEHGISVEKRFVEDEFLEEDYSIYRENMRKAHEELAEEDIDVYILTTSVLADEDILYVLEPFAEKGIPTYSINSTQDVHNGAMAAVALLDYKSIGKFASENIQKLINGTELGILPEIYNTAPYLVFNFDTVRETGYQVPFQILVSADEICFYDN